MSSTERLDAGDGSSHLVLIRLSRLSLGSTLNTSRPFDSDRRSLYRAIAFLDKCGSIMSAQPKEKYYTLEEARAVLPIVKDLMKVVQDARLEIMRLRSQAWPALRNAATNGGNREAGELLAHFDRLEAGIKGVTDMGILVKDVDKGLIDFLGQRDGQDIFLCWHYGEDDIQYWHEINAGFAGRHPIDSLVR